ncbi:MAG TPA: type IX secretion system sortase PorU [Chitinophagaceae bacterium]|nr:type IX secretion system sortase PorU [Chitinophagaceae bacterium]
MFFYRYFVVIAWFFFVTIHVSGQRTYAANSVLSSGNWYKIAVKDPGVYKIDIPFLNNLGITTSNLASSTVRLFGNGGQMLPESNADLIVDDLQENAIMVVDGGDGILNGSDYILFYASGPDGWIKDSINSRFSHKKNIYTDKAFYFLSMGGNGKRIQMAQPILSPGLIITSYSGRYFHELDTFNFLASGKEWYGEEFANAPGKQLSRTFSLNTPEIINGSQIIFKGSCVSRSVGVGSRFDISINNQPAAQILINSISGGQYDLFAREEFFSGTGISNPGTTSIGYSYIPGSFNAQGWLNWFELFTREKLSIGTNGQLLFRDWQSVGNNVGEFIVANSNNSTQVWDITDPLTPISIPGSVTNNEFHFINNCSALREYVTFNSQNFLTPEIIGKVANQNLHNSSPADMIIVSYPEFLSQAQRLAQLHNQKNGLNSKVVTTEQVYNEFAGGNPDPTSIRNFVKMYHDKYSGNPATKLKYLLLLGDASYDYKTRITNNTNYVPAYENNFSLDPLSTYASDDYFGFLDDNEDINSGTVINLLDIGVGRIPARSNVEAKNFVDKMESYYSSESLGPWRNNLTFIADDEDGNLHLQDAEIITTTAISTSPVFNLQKIYLDAFQQESGSGGNSYPQANQAINSQIYNGTLIWNYNGHGGARRLAEETIVDADIVNGWNNPQRLPLFITATCDFAPYDNPAINSIGENLLVRPKNGAIALMTTTRVVFAFSNRIMNNNYIKHALEQNGSGGYRSLGDAIMAAKNFTYQTSGDVANNRKFTLLGDPALTLGFPEYRAVVTKVNNIPASQPDTLSSTESVTVEGIVTDLSGNLLNNFNGKVYSLVYDKPQVINTLANDPGSQVTSFQAQNNILFKGKSSVINGTFSFSFKVPKDINYQYGNGKISLYAENGSKDANGYFTNFLVGGVGNSSFGDNEGPEIRLYLNDDKFVNGGITNQAPILIVKLSDSSGINTVGNGIGHDIVATLDENNNKYFILNDLYQGELDSYQKGEVRFQLPELESGPHSIKIKAWDVVNNSNEAQLEFVVGADEELMLSHVLNYPNPFTTSTTFWFEHNQPGRDLYINLQIFTLTGKIIKTIKKTINTTGNRSCELEWDGRDEFGDKLGRGVYLYRLRVSTTDGVKKEKIEKFVIF